MRRVEVLSGVAGGTVGLLGLGVALVGVGRRTTPGAASILFLVALTLALLGVAIGAYLHGGRGLRDGRTVLWLSVGLLGIGTVLAAASFGAVLLPAMALGVVAAVAAAAPSD